MSACRLAETGKTVFAYIMQFPTRHCRLSSHFLLETHKVLQINSSLSNASRHITYRSTIVHHGLWLRLHVQLRRFLWLHVWPGLHLQNLRGMCVGKFREDVLLTTCAEMRTCSNWAVYGESFPLGVDRAIASLRFSFRSEVCRFQSALCSRHVS